MGIPPPRCSRAAFRSEQPPVAKHAFDRGGRLDNVRPLSGFRRCQQPPDRAIRRIERCLEQHVRGIAQRDNWCRLQA